MSPSPSSRPRGISAGEPGGAPRVPPPEPGIPGATARSDSRDLPSAVRRAFGEAWASRFARVLAAIVVLGLVVQIAVALSQNVDMDEGQVLQATLLILHGKVPMVDFPAREPLLPYVLVPSVVAAGPSLAAARSEIALLNACTAVLLALAARRLAGPRGEVAGWAVAGLYLLSPFALLWMTVLVEEPLSGLLLAASFLTLVLPRRELRPRDEVMAGILLGLAVLARRGVLLVALPWLLWVVLHRTGLRARVAAGARFLLAAAVLPVTVLLSVAGRTSWAWALTELGTGTEVYGQGSLALPYRLEVWGFVLLVAAPLLLAATLELAQVLRARLPRRAGLAAVPLAGGAAAVLLTFYPSYTSYGTGEFLSPYTAAWTGAVLALTGLATLLTLARGRQDPGPLGARGTLLLAGWALGAEAGDLFARPVFFVVYTTDALAPLALLAAAWTAAAVLPRTGGDLPRGRVVPDGAPRDGAAGSPHQGPAPGPGSDRRSASPFRSPRRDPLLPTVRALLTVLFILLASGGAALGVLGPTNPRNLPGPSAPNAPNVFQRTYPIPEVDQVVATLDRTFPPTAPLFSLDDTFLSAAGRTNTPAIGYALDPYLHLLFAHAPSNATPYPSAPPGLAPSLSGLLALWNATPLAGIVVGVRTGQAESYAPLFAWYVATSFYPVATFGDVQSGDVVAVEVRGPAPAPSLLSTMNVSLPGGFSSVALGPGSSMVYAPQAQNASLLEVNRSTGRTSSDPLPGFAPTGAGAVLAAFGRVWVASAGGDLVDGVVPGGGPAVVLRVPLGPTALAADAPAGSLLVTSAPTPSTGWLTQLLMGPGGSWSTGWSVPVGEGPTSVAVDPIGHRAYVASPGDRALDVLDDRNGALLTTLTSPHEPLDVLSAGGALLVSWWEGSIWRMDPSTGQVGATAYVPQGVVQIVLDPTGGTLAAVSRSAGVVTVLRAADLLRVGVFNVTGCPLALAWGGSLGPLAVAESCQPALEIGVAPPQANLTLATPDGATVYVGGVPSVPGKGLPLWPQVLVLTSVSTGHLPGIDLVGWTGGPVTVTLGPSWSDLNATSAVFATEVVVLTAGLGTGMAWVWTGMPWPGRGVPPRRREVKGPQP